MKWAPVRMEVRIGFWVERETAFANRARIISGQLWRIVFVITVEFRSCERIKLGPRTHISCSYQHFQLL